MTNQIFISYSKKDKGFSWKLADDLANTGHKVWIDRSLQVGEDWKRTIEKKLEEADEVIVCAVIKCNRFEMGTARGINRVWFEKENVPGVN